MSRVTSTSRSTSAGHEHQILFIGVVLNIACSVGDDGMLRLWDRRSSEPLQTHVAHDNWYVQAPDLIAVLSSLLTLVQVLWTCHQSISRPTYCIIPTAIFNNYLSIFSFFHYSFTLLKIPVALAQRNRSTFPPTQVTCGADGRVKLWMLTSASSAFGGSAGSAPAALAESSGSKLDGMVSMNSNFTDSL